LRIKELSFSPCQRVCKNVKGKKIGLKHTLKRPDRVGISSPSPRVFVSVASKGLSLAVSLLFATFAWRSISVAVKRLKAMVGSNLDRVGECHWTVVSGEETGRRESARDRRARMCGGTSRLSVNKHGRE
jgi:hypothetical protein